ncbi:hypothetical protein AYO38_11425 [bacterium SCGC AG-212-C10]|nr:hypothetical protein AYO38_11425 [bacterium SCGC AG-212-C10]
MSGDTLFGKHRPPRGRIAFLLFAIWLLFAATRDFVRGGHDRPLRRRPRAASAAVDLHPRPRRGVVTPGARAHTPATEQRADTRPWPTTAIVSPPEQPAPVTLPATLADPSPAAQRSRGLAKPVPVMHALRVFAAGTMALVLAALLNADQLLHEAETKPFGRDRDFWVAVWTPFANVSDATGLNLPRRWLDEALDKGSPSSGPNGIAALLAPTQTAITNTPTPTITGAETASPTPAPSATPTPTPPPATLVRHPTSDAPLKMYIGGDSMAGIYGQSLVRAATDTGLIEADLDYRVSTGLTRPDYFDWPAELAAVSSSEQPDVMVVMFGANDPQGIRTPDGKVFQPVSDGWVVEYRRRVAATMDELNAPGRMVIWTGQPVMESADLSEKVAAMNQVFSEEAAKRPWVVYLDSWSVMADSHGKYSAYLPDGDGDQQLMRAGDGIHLSRAGGDRLAAAAMRIVAKEAGLAP